MPTLTTAGRIAALSLQGDTAFITLLTVTHASFGTERFTDNSENVVSNGNTYYASGFILELPLNGDGVPTGKLRIKNVSRYIWQLIETLDTSPVFDIAIALASAPDTIIDEQPNLRLYRANADEAAVEASLSHTYYIDKPLPAPRMTPEYFPWLAR